MLTCASNPLGFFQTGDQKPPIMPSCWHCQAASQTGSKWGKLKILPIFSNTFRMETAWCSETAEGGYLGGVDKRNALVSLVSKAVK